MSAASCSLADDGGPCDQYLNCQERGKQEGSTAWSPLQRCQRGHKQEWMPQPDCLWTGSGAWCPLLVTLEEHIAAKAACHSLAVPEAVQVQPATQGKRLSLASLWAAGVPPAAHTWAGSFCRPLRGG